MNAKLKIAVSENIKLIIAGIGLSSLSVIFGSLIITFFDILEQIQRWGIGFVKSTLKFNIFTFLENLVYIFPVSILGGAIAYWLWKNNSKDVTQISSIKISILIGLVGGCVGAISTYKGVDNFDAFSVDTLKLIAIFIAWILGSVIWGWGISKSLGNSNDN